MIEGRSGYIPTPRWRKLIKRLLYDRRLGIETDAQIEADALGLDNVEYHGYEAAEWGSLKYVLPRGSVGSDDVFVDLGAGMGRVVFLALSFPFKRVVGVELSEALHRKALENRDAVLARRRRLRRRTPEIELLVNDASTYPLPHDATFVYMNNPFHGDVFDAVVRNMIASVDAAPRRLTVIYRNPVEHDRLIGSGRFRLVAQSDRVGLGGRQRGVTTNVYEHVFPEPAARGEDAAAGRGPGAGE